MDHWFSKNLLSKFYFRVMLVAMVVASGVLIYGWKCLAYDKLKVPNTGYEFFIESGTSLTQFSNALHTAGILEHPRLLSWYAILTNNTNNIKTGEYQIMPGTSALQFLKIVSLGMVTQYSFTIVEGLKSSQVISLLQQHPKIKPTLKNLSDAEIVAKLNLPMKNLEGVFLADTYFFEAYTTDLEFLRRAYLSMEQNLSAAWEGRSRECILKTPYDALILASIIEKESALAPEYDEISGVYQRRIVQGMKLQADPTVIYAMQDKLQGPLLRKHLTLNSPYNTYKFNGLPPTPIAIPSQAALEAALNPSQSENLYFVATKDGSHIFSKTLQEHNIATAAVRSKI